MTIRSKTLPALLTIAMLAGSSLAFATDNNKPDNATSRDETTTGSINSEGRTPTPEEREYCQTAPAGDSTCQSLGLAPNN